MSILAPIGKAMYRNIYVQKLVNLRTEKFFPIIRIIKIKIIIALIIIIKIIMMTIKKTIIKLVII